jgi:ppGpp synthetase/RelA/SpoT-type nucleotidyltranferase
MQAVWSLLTEPLLNVEPQVKTVMQAVWSLLTEPLLNVEPQMKTVMQAGWSLYAELKRALPDVEPHERTALDRV